jgi:hypothetical protein
MNSLIMADEPASDTTKEGAPRSNLERLLDHLQGGTLASELVRGRLQAETDEAGEVALKKIIHQRLERAKNDSGGTAG